MHDPLVQWLGHRSGGRACGDGAWLVVLLLALSTEMAVNTDDCGPLADMLQEQYGWSDEAVRWLHNLKAEADAQKELLHETLAACTDLSEIYTLGNDYDWLWIEKKGESYIFHQPWKHGTIITFNASIQEMHRWPLYNTIVKQHTRYASLRILRRMTNFQTLPHYCAGGDDPKKVIKIFEGLIPEAVTDLLDGRMFMANAYALSKLPPSTQQSELYRARSLSPYEFVPRVRTLIKDTQNGRRRGRNSER